MTYINNNNVKIAHYTSKLDVLHLLIVLLVYFFALLHSRSSLVPLKFSIKKETFKCTVTIKKKQCIISPTLPQQRTAYLMKSWICISFRFSKAHRRKNCSVLAVLRWLCYPLCLVSIFSIWKMFFNCSEILSITVSFMFSVIKKVRIYRLIHYTRI